MSDAPQPAASSPEAIFACDHGVTFDEDAYKVEKLSEQEIRKRYPRLDGLCPKGCGFRGIAYASYLHYIAGDW